MKMTDTLLPIATALLQDRLDGKLKQYFPAGFSECFHLLQKYQPKEGFAPGDVAPFSHFTLLLDDCDVIPHARRVAEQFNIELRY